MLPPTMWHSNRGIGDMSVDIVVDVRYRSAQTKKKQKWFGHGAPEGGLANFGETQMVWLKKSKSKISLETFEVKTAS